MKETPALRGGKEGCLPFGPSWPGILGFPNGRCRVAIVRCCGWNPTELQESRCVLRQLLGLGMEI